MPPMLSYGGGGGDKVIIHQRLYVVGFPRKGISAAVLGRDIILETR